MIIYSFNKAKPYFIGNTNNPTSGMIFTLCEIPFNNNLKIEAYYENKAGEYAYIYHVKK